MLLQLACVVLPSGEGTVVFEAESGSESIRVL